MRGERDRAREEHGRSSDNAVGLVATIARHVQAQKKLLRMIYAGDLKAARLAGYIDHVREAAAITGPAANAEDHFDVDYERDRLINASERQFGQIIDGMNSEALDIVLGREEE